MPAERYFLRTSFSQGEILSLEGEEFIHLARVMRTSVGETIEIINGQSQLAVALVKKIDKRGAELSIQTVHTAPSSRQIILAQALPRLNRLEFIIEKGTELGATAFWLFPGERSEKKTLSDQQCHRLDHLAIAALKQCGRLDLPEIHMKPPLLQWEPLKITAFFGDVREKATSFHPPKEGPLCIFIGPEKGFSPQEIAYLEGPLQAQGVRLHHNILRVDTAAIVGLALMNLV